MNISKFSIRFFALVLALGSTSAFAEWVVIGKHPDILKAQDIADYKAAKLAVEKKRCVAYYSERERCDYISGEGISTPYWQCKAGTSKHKGSCGGNAYENAKDDFNTMKPIVEEVGSWLNQ